METRAYHNNLLATLLTPQQSQARSSGALPQNQKPEQARDSVDFSTRAQETSHLLGQTRLISETIEQIDNGIRRTQLFEKSDGRQFTKIEELITTDKQSRRTVVQQNTSGSATLLEDIYDRQDDGSFRLTQRFTNEIGETSVNIDPNAIPPSADIVFGRAPNGTPAASSLTPRGSEINVVV